MACAEDHSGGALCALTLKDGDEAAACQRLLSLPLEAHRCALTCVCLLAARMP